MKNHASALLAVSAGLIGLFCAGTSYARFQTDLQSQASVRASASWDVRISDASISDMSQGVRILPPSDEPSEDDGIRVSTTVYDVIVKYDPDPEGTGGRYYLCIDDSAPVKTELTREEFDAYSYVVILPGEEWKDLHFYETGQEGCMVSWRLNLNQEARSLGFEQGRFVVDTDSYEAEGMPAGKAIAVRLADDMANPWNLETAWTRTDQSLREQSQESLRQGTISEDGLHASFPSLSMSLPGAWAQYSLTLTNEGTAEAWLSDWTFDLEQELGQLSFDGPGLPASEVLYPGESCTLTFTGYVDVLQEGMLDDASLLHIGLHYDQAVVEPAPEPGHTH